MQNDVKIFWVNIFAFFLSLHYAVVSYSGSFFLAGLVHLQNIWIIYFIGSTIAIILNLSASKFLKKININKLMLSTILLTTVNSALLFYTTTPFLLCLEFILYYCLGAFLYTLASIILEEFSKNSNTGGIRGKYSAILGGGYLLAPFMASIFILNFGIKSIFILSSLFALATLVVFYNFVNRVPKISYQQDNVKSGLAKLFKSHDLSYITIAQVGISAFYALLGMYMPFKLLPLGINLTQYLSVLLPIALTPFLFMPPILGYLEDQMKDEKEILLVALIGLIIAIGIIAICNSHSLLVWAIILFFSRICASSAEISTNSYIYKKIQASEVTIISIFLSTDYIVGILFVPLFSIVLRATDIKILFLSVSFFLCFVIVLVSKINDTKNYEKHQNIQKEWKDIWGRSKTRSKRGIVS